ncbi:hypothetical protein [Bacillus benzoevorans]|uniref:Uncharacterized protein n=1 Tax=Bacillus benzoevorans TaxID=1456 RepID=A0A7X0HSM2_9BACI|nr:hypothetical protein [Bacillus benzoevorans]MBB6446100.1 hypothetical protein [Bacillus benzoevorans]
MSYQINGLKDIHKILMNNRRINGVVEVETLRLRTGEVYHNAVITNIDLIGSSIYSIGFMTEDQENLIINISELGMLHEAKHKKIRELNNQSYKKIKTEEKLKFLQRLYQVNEGSRNPIFVEEAAAIIEDIGQEAAAKAVDTSIIFPKGRVYSIA